MIYLDVPLISSYYLNLNLELTFLPWPWRFDTSDTSTRQTPGLGKTLRIAATTILNLNVSAANLDTFAEAVVSWCRQREIEQKAVKLNEVR